MVAPIAVGVWLEWGQRRSDLQSWKVVFIIVRLQGGHGEMAGNILKEKAPETKVPSHWKDPSQGQGQLLYLL